MYVSFNLSNCQSFEGEFLLFCSSHDNSGRYISLMLFFFFKYLVHLILNAESGTLKKVYGLVLDTNNDLYRGFNSS